MADYFKCDCGYLLCDYDEPIHDLKDICNVTGLSEKAIFNLRTVNSKLASKIIESKAFQKIVNTFSAAKRNKNLLHPSGDNIAAGIMAKIYHDDIPEVFAQALVAVGESGLAPVYKQELTELICKLFDDITEKGE